ncbi:hypothetical protein CHS0354_035358 [Potamilus streckersoni]|uniref:Inhibitor I9 domain-containing protein n=1 Tax=Potamilus streckersoni TaxID=2493646 RepID=A0AAE0S2V9_9BIVA|nr:hypothetical protein CHS0354_035358 [Potamilus streckersoni]
MSIGILIAVSCTSATNADKPEGSDANNFKKVSDAPELIRKKIPAEAQERLSKPANTGSISSEEPVLYIVQMNPGYDEKDLRVVFQQLNPTQVNKLMEYNGVMFSVDFVSDPGIEALKKASAGDKRIQFVQQNHTYKAIQK